MSAGYISISDTLTPKLERMGRSLDGIIQQGLRYQESNVQDYMRQNAPWTDRTANARGGLFAKYAKTADNEHSIVIYHTMPYGIWLEVRWNGKYAIINPTLQAEGPRVVQFMDKIFQKLADA